MDTLIKFLALLLGMGFPVSQAPAQTYPVKPLRIVVPAAAGGAGDIRGRIFAQALSVQLGQPVLIQNQGGGGGVAGANIVAKASRDGYTAGLFPATVLATAALLSDNLPYDPERDFEPISLIAYTPQVLVVDTKLRLNSVQDLISHAKANPGKLNFGSSGTSSTTRLAMELFKGEAGVDMLHVPYQSIGLAIIDLLGGRVQLVVSDVSAAQPHINSGALKPLAVTSARGRAARLPNVPTTAEVGLPRVISDNFTGLVAPAGTAPQTLRQLNEATTAALKRAAIEQQLAEQGVIATPGSPDEFRTLVRGEKGRWAPIIKTYGIRAD